LQIDNIADKIVRHSKKNPVSGCIEWQRAKCGRGYGYIRNSTGQFKVHRCSYEIFVGKAANKLWVLHECDNPICCNPAHLFLGTCQDNHDDMAAKGRHRIGENSPLAKLSDDNVVEIRTRYASGLFTMREIASTFGVTNGLVFLIVSGRQRRNAGGPVTIGNRAKKITREIAEEIRSRYIPRKFGGTRLAREYGIDQATVYEILSRQIWK
jgi:hypothetical protein